MRIAGYFFLVVSVFVTAIAVLLSFIAGFGPEESLPTALLLRLAFGAAFGAPFLIVGIILIWISQKKSGHKKLDLDTIGKIGIVALIPFILLFHPVGQSLLWLVLKPLLPGKPDPSELQMEVSKYALETFPDVCPCRVDDLDSRINCHPNYLRRRVPNCLAHEVDHKLIKSLESLKARKSKHELNPSYFSTLCPNKTTQLTHYISQEKIIPTRKELQRGLIEEKAPKRVSFDWDGKAFALDYDLKIRSNQGEVLDEIDDFHVEGSFDDVDLFVSPYRIYIVPTYSDRYGTKHRVIYSYDRKTWNRTGRHYVRCWLKKIVSIHHDPNGQDFVTCGYDRRTMPSFFDFYENDSMRGRYFKELGRWREVLASSTELKPVEKRTEYYVRNLIPIYHYTARCIRNEGTRK